MVDIYTLNNLVIIWLSTLYVCDLHQKHIMVSISHMISNEWGYQVCLDAVKHGPMLLLLLQYTYKT